MSDRTMKKELVQVQVSCSPDRSSSIDNSNGTVPTGSLPLVKKEEEAKKFTTIIGIHRTDSSCYNLNRVRVLYYKQSKKRRKIPDPKKC